MSARAANAVLLLCAACTGPDAAVHPPCIGPIDASSLSPIETRVLAEAARRIEPRCSGEDASEQCGLRIDPDPDGGWIVWIDYRWQNPRSGECLQMAGGFEAQRYDASGRHLDSLHGF